MLFKHSHWAAALKVNYSEINIKQFNRNKSLVKGKTGEKLETVDNFKYLRSCGLLPLHI